MTEPTRVATVLDVGERSHMYSRVHAPDCLGCRIAALFQRASQRQVSAQ